MAKIILALILLTISQKTLGKPNPVKRREVDEYTDYMPTRGDLPDFTDNEIQFLVPQWTPSEVELTPEIIEEEFVTTYPALDRRKINISLIPMRIIMSYLIYTIVSCLEED